MNANTQEMNATIDSRRRWQRTIPIVFVTYSLAYLDRVNFGFAAAGGMAADLKISASQSSLLGAVFFLAYFLFQIPGTVYAERRSVKRLIFWCILSWGILASLTGLVANLTALIAIRFLLGVAEAAVMPAMLVFLSHWFTRKERSTANTFLVLGNPVTVIWMSVLSGYLVHAFNWRWMFILEGLPAIVWAFCWLAWANDYPRQASWLSETEKDRVEAALLAEQSGLRAVRNYAEAFRSPTVICLAAQYFCWSVGVYGFVLWLPTILREASQASIVNTGWLSALPYAAAVPAMLFASRWSDRCAHRKRFVWPALLLASFAFFGSYAIGAEHFKVSYALLVVAGVGMYLPYGPFFAIVPEILPRNVAGGAMALINSFGAVGGFVGSYFVGYLTTTTGSPTYSYVLMSAALLASAILTFLLPGKRDTPARNAPLPHDTALGQAGAK
ncbi:MAG TPA: MFS transporter [Opitutaceae bacterium]|nr:MFS transporter [Opitutaceae bacterium]